MAFKILSIVAGRIKEVLIGVQASAGAGDANKPILTDSSGKLDPTFLPAGVGSASKSIQASEALSGPNFVNVWNDSGTVKVRKADATAVGKEANGFILASASSGANATVYFDDEVTGLSSLTPGTRYYLSTTPGTVTDTPPSATGNVVQCLGVAVSATSLVFAPSEPIELA